MIYLILATLLYTVAILFGAAASRRIDTNLSTVLNNAFSVVIPLAVTGIVFVKKGVSTEKTGIIFAIVSGLLLGLFVMALNKSYSVNKVGIVAPVVFGGAIFLSTMLSYFIFKEKVSMTQGVGLAFLGIGFCVLVYSQLVGK